MKMYIFTFLIILTLGGYAQNTTKFRYNIEKSLYTHYHTYGGDLYDHERFANKAYMFGFAIFVNPLGKVEKVVFTNQSKELDSLVSFKKIEERFKSDTSTFKPYKNTILVSAALVRRGEDYRIENFYDKFLQKEVGKIDFDQLFYDLIPDMKLLQSKNKTLQLLPFFSMVQGKIQH